MKNMGKDKVLCVYSSVVREALVGDLKNWVEAQAAGGWGKGWSRGVHICLSHYVTNIKRILAL